jgi:peptidoglycan/LPS O-acetylase OafA/YrhL
MPTDGNAAAFKTEPTMLDHARPSWPSGDTCSRKVGRHHELDGIRAIACVLVVIHHSFTSAASSFVSHFSHSASQLLFFTTASGVECFFCLSCFILVYPYVIGEKPLRLKPYVTSRLRRIYPPFIVAWLLAGMVQYVVTSCPTWYSRSLPEFNTSAWLSQFNIFTLLGCSALYNGAWWSLAVECVWYALVPAVVWGCKRFKALRLSAVWMAITAATLPLSLVVCDWASVTPVALYGSAQALACFLAFATCFTSAIWLLVCYTGIAGLWVCGGVGIALILYCGLSCDFGLIHGGFGLFWASIIGLCMRIPSLRSLVSTPRLVWLGDRSYSLFLTHCTVFVATNWVVSLWTPSRTATYGFATRAIGLPLALCVAVMLFWYVERHFSGRLTTANDFWPPRG